MVDFWTPPIFTKIYIYYLSYDIFLTEFCANKNSCSRTESGYEMVLVLNGDISELNKRTFCCNLSNVAKLTSLEHTTKTALIETKEHYYN